MGRDETACRLRGGEGVQIGKPFARQRYRIRNNKFKSIVPKAYAHPRLIARILLCFSGQPPETKTTVTLTHLLGEVGVAIES